MSRRIGSAITRLQRHRPPLGADERVEQLDYDAEATEVDESEPDDIEPPA